MSFYIELEDNTNMTEADGAIEYYSEDVDEEEKTKETNSRVRGDSKDWVSGGVPQPGQSGSK